MTWRKAAVLSAGVGVLVSCILLIAAHATMGTSTSSNAGYYVNRTMRILWPSSIWLMATEGIEATWTGYFIVALSTLGNGILYAVLGSLVWWLQRTISR
ncbi:MAG TPA: hypothetical protein VGH51_03305 [Candidatus Angelobacter sp.]|jgi:hypothetical protein